MNMQIQMVREPHALPLTRDYMVEAKRAAVRTAERVS
jgi:hypothetical protein